MHPDAKGPLAKVNGENDAACGSGSSSVIQFVWENVLTLATGVGGRHSGGGGAGGLPPATPVTGAGVLEAAATRRKALELIEVRLVCLHEPLCSTAAQLAGPPAFMTMACLSSSF